MMLLADAISEFLADCELGNLSADTLRTYREVLKALSSTLDDGTPSLDTVGTVEMRAYMLELWKREKAGKLSVHTIGKHDRHLRVFWDFCRKSGWVDLSPMKALRRPKLPPVKPSGIPHADVIRLLEACDHHHDEIEGARNKAIILLFLDTGARRGGIARLTTNKLDLMKKCATVTEKGGKTRRVFFSYFTAQALRLWFRVRESSSDAVFTSVRTGQPLGESGFNQMMKRTKKAAGVTSRVSPQRFRNSFAREFVRQGGDISVLARLLGHSDVKITHDYYAVFDDGELQELHAETGVMSSVLRSGQ
jgi:integrase/recombinase XerD